MIARPNNSGRAALAALLLAFLPCLLAPAAQAAPQPLASGAARLRIAPQLRRALAREGIRIEGRAGARANLRGARLALAAGSFEPLAPKAELEYAGAIRLVARGRAIGGNRHSLSLQRIRLDTNRSQPLIAKLGGSQLKIAKARVRTERSGFGLSATAKRLYLTKKAATRLDKRLNTTAFQAGELLGSLTASAEVALVNVVPQGRATLVPTPGFQQTLEALHVSMLPISPVELAPGPLFTAPIAGGSLAPDAAQGVAKTSGALEFIQERARQVFWHEIWLDFADHTAIVEVTADPSPPFAGRQPPAPVLGLATGSVAAEPAARTISVSGSMLALSAGEAALFNQMFGEGGQPFAAGEAVGAVSFTAQAE